MLNLTHKIAHPTLSFGVKVNKSKNDLFLCVSDGTHTHTLTSNCGKKFQFCVTSKCTISHKLLMRKWQKSRTRTKNQIRNEEQMSDG